MANVSRVSLLKARQQVWSDCNGSPIKLLELQKKKGAGSRSYNIALERGQRWAMEEIYNMSANPLACLI